MKTASKFAIVLVTVPDLKTARELADAALQTRLIACANIVPKIESHFWWQGKIQSSAEALLILKTSKPKLAPLERLILARHPYNTPEILALPFMAATGRYLRWLGESIKRR